MALEQITSPPILDSTGLLIKQALADIKGAIELDNIATVLKPGAVKPDGETIVVDATGLIELFGVNNAGAHNSVYRGKNLGTSVSADQWAQIIAGTFKGMYIGDYWVINGVTWRIAAFDYWLNCGDQGSGCTTHHVVIVPDTNLLAPNGSTTHYMNDQNTTEGGYVGSGFFSGTQKGGGTNTARADCRTAIQNAFGSAHILTHREYFTNAVVNGKPSGEAWVDSDVDCMNERMVYGNAVFEPANDGTTIPYLYTIDKSQLPLFAFNPALICNRADWWLRDVVSAAVFAYVHSHGLCHVSNASYAWVGVRPAFAIC